ncbi:hypothetical protein F8388_023204 [Cannabis sativa]|uniref:Uncharacterized protein n=1 Tax=Cannabis sativa TaxID=3483 RepID=A0A7J6HG47_CANSA|nr:hypothetical protein F8388_023204 [Cannabis sativa]
MDGEESGERRQETEILVLEKVSCNLIGMIIRMAMVRPRSEDIRRRESCFINPLLSDKKMGLKQVKYHESVSRYDSTECSVCLNEFIEEEKVALTLCSHGQRVCFFSLESSIDPLFSCREDKGGLEILLFFPNSTSHPKLQLFPVSPREGESHISLDNETIKTVTNFSVTVPNASWNPLPYHLPPMSTHFKTVVITLCLNIITHKPKESYVDGSCTELESFKMQTKILAKTAENLQVD